MDVCIADLCIDVVRDNCGITETVFTTFSMLALGHTGSLY